jgi:hypothetical protein
MPAALAKPRRQPSAEPAAQRLGLDDEGERLHSVDLDHGDRLAKPRLELDVATDVHGLEILPTNLGHDLERPLAEVAALGVVDPDAAQG